MYSDNDRVKHLICLDIKDNQKPKFKHNMDSYKEYNQMKMQITSCTQEMLKPGRTCKSPAEVKKFLNSFLWRMNVVQDQIDFSVYEKKPVTKRIKQLSFGQIDYSAT